MNKSLLTKRENEKNPNFIQKNKDMKRNRSVHEFKKINYLVHTNKKPKQVEVLEYDQLELKISKLDEENFLLKEELNELKQELFKMRKIANSHQIRI